MTDAERTAYGLVAKAIAQHAFATATATGKDYIGKFPEAQRPIYYHLSDSTFEAVAYDLWRLSIFRPLDQRRDWAYHFAFACDVSESDVVAVRNSVNGPTFFQLMVTFINLFGDYGPEYWGFSTKQNTPFGISSRIMPVLDAFVALGYLTRTEAGYVWTERIAPIMRESYNRDRIDPEARLGQSQGEAK